MLRVKKSQKNKPTERKSFIPLSTVTLTFRIYNLEMSYGPEWQIAPAVKSKSEDKLYQNDITKTQIGLIITIQKSK
jgi:hypothetical protein